MVYGVEAMENNVRDVLSPSSIYISTSTPHHTDTVSVNSIRGSHWGRTHNIDHVIFILTTKKKEEK